MVGTEKASFPLDFKPSHVQEIQYIFKRVVITLCFPWLPSLVVQPSRNPSHVYNSESLVFCDTDIVFTVLFSIATDQLHKVNRYSIPQELYIATPMCLISK